MKDYVSDKRDQVFSSMNLELTELLSQNETSNEDNPSGEENTSSEESTSEDLTDTVVQAQLVQKEEIYETIDLESSIDEDTSKLYKMKRRELKHNVGRELRQSVLADPVKIYINIYFILRNI